MTPNIRGSEQPKRDLLTRCTPAGAKENGRLTTDAIEQHVRQSGSRFETSLVRAVPPELLVIHVKMVQARERYSSS